MKRIRNLLFVAVLALTAMPLLAQSSANYEIGWDVLAGGGQPSSSANYRVVGTIGQGMAGPPAAQSAGYRLESGFWVGEDDQTEIYLPFVTR